MGGGEREGKEKGRRGREREMGTARPPQLLGAVYAPANEVAIRAAVE